jgi:vacuolar-type H+-ATPase subunit F/Vma7
MPRVVAVLGEQAALGFALTGVEVMRAAGTAGARAALQEASADAGNGLVIVEQALFDGLEQPELRWVPEGQAEKDAHVADLVRHAVGYQLNIQP